MGLRFYFGPQMWPWSKLRVEDKGSEERRIHVGWVNVLSNSGVKLFWGWWEEWGGAVQRTRANLNLLGTGVASSQRLEGAVRACMWDSVYILVVLLWWRSGVQCCYSDPFIYLFSTCSLRIYGWHTLFYITGITSWTQLTEPCSPEAKVFPFQNC